MRQIILGFALLSAVPVSATDKHDLRGSETENFSSRGLDLHLSSAKARYRRGENITVNMELMNRGFYPVTIYVHRNYLRNFTLIAREKSGLSLPMKDIQYFKEYEDYRDPFFRDYTGNQYQSRAIVIQPGESFTRQVNLADLIRLDNAGSELNLSAYFYPNPDQNPDLFTESANTMRLQIDSAAVREAEEPVLPVEKNELRPKEAVFLAFSAEFTRDWPAFFKFISLKDLIRDYPAFARDYMRMEEKNRPAVLEQFRRYLMSRKDNRLLSFEIEEENPQEGAAGNASVRVKARRMMEGYSREFRYTVYLTRSGALWTITGMESQLIR